MHSFPRHDCRSAAPASHAPPFPPRRIPWTGGAAARTVALAVLLSLAALAAACGGDNPADNADPAVRLSVVATIPPIGALAKEVGGDRVALTTILSPGTDPHTYEITAGNRKKLDAARVVLRNGRGIDAFLDRAIDPGSPRVTTVTTNVPKRNLVTAAGTDNNAEDPHAWHDPENDKIMVDAIAAAFANADPANSGVYTANAAAYKAKLDDTDRQVRALIDSIPPENRKLVTNHDAIGYFIARYGLTYVGAVIPSLSTEAEPSAKDIADLVDLIKREKVKAIFAESSIDPRIANEIANDTGVTIVKDLYGDSIGPPGSGADTVDGMLLANARKIAEALR